MSHDPLCPFIEDTDGVIYGWNACQCDLIEAVRIDQKEDILKLIRGCYLPSIPYDHMPRDVGPEWAEAIDYVLATLRRG